MVLRSRTLRARFHGAANDRPLRSSVGVFLALAALLGGCADSVEPEQGPEEITLEPGIQWAGGIVTASSPDFADLEPGYAFLVDDDTVESWRSGPEELSLRLPNPTRSGDAYIEIEIDTIRRPAGSVEVVGNAYPVRVLQCDQPCAYAPVLDEYPFFKHGVAVGPGRLLGHFSRYAPDGEFGSGMAVASLDGPSPTVRWVDGLEGPSDAEDLPGLVAPGYGADGNWIVDTSSADTAVQPSVWDFVPESTEVGLLACLPDGLSGGYAVAELASGDCLVLTGTGADGLEGPGALTINGTAPVPGYATLPYEASAACATLVRSGNAEWATVRSMWDGQLCARLLAPPPELPAWPVLDAAGNASFATSRYPQWVRGADFVAGDTLWVVGEAGAWTLDAWDPGSGELLVEVSLPEATGCTAVLADPVRPYVYAACRISDDYQEWPALFVYDRSRGEVVAILETEMPESFLFPAWSPFTLVHGGSNGRVHLTAVWDGTTAAAERGVMVATYDVF